MPGGEFQLESAGGTVLLTAMNHEAARKPFILSPRAIVHDGHGRYLFLRRSAASKRFGGHWEPPGGKADAGETIDVALEREVMEETGLRIRDLHVLGALEGDTPEARYVTVVFEVECEPGKVRLSDEHDDALWLTPEEAVKLEISPMYVRFIAEWAATKSH